MLSLQKTWHSGSNFASLILIALWQLRRIILKKTQFANTAQMYVVAMPRLNDVFRLQLYLELGYNIEESFIDKASWDTTGQRSVTVVCYFKVFLLDYSSTLQKIPYDDWDRKGEGKYRPIPINTSRGCPYKTHKLNLYLPSHYGYVYLHQHVSVTFLGCTQNYFDQFQSNLGQQIFMEKPNVLCWVHSFTPPNFY